MSSRRKARKKTASRDYGSREKSVSLYPTARKFTVCRLLSGQIVPDKMIVPLKFCESRTLTSSGNGAYTYSQNSAYDPNVTGTGQQPMGFNSLMALYWRYRVIASKIKFTAAALGAVDGIMLCVAPTSVDPGTGAQAVDVARFKFAKPHCLKMLPSSGGPPLILEDAINTSDIAGTPLYDDTEFFGDVGADPVNQYYWVLAYNQSNPSGQFTWTVEIEYLTEFTEARDNPS